MIRDAALLLSSVMLVAGSVACGRTDPGDDLEVPPGDASSLDAGHDSSLGQAEAAVTDSNAGADRTALADSYAGADEGTAADSALDASPFVDAAEGPDAGTDGSTEASADANADAFTSDAAEQPLACDQCTRGDQECAAPEICTYSDAGVILSCARQAILTCVTGDAGCAVWGESVACRSDIPCCVPCRHQFACPSGNYGNPCEHDTDCAFNACDSLTHQCVFGQCGDHHQDGDESDVDCGGGACGACLVGQRCQSNFDCQSGHLCVASHVCQ
jgi:hypothetical protein